MREELVTTPDPDNLVKPRVNRLLKRARDGDTAALPALRQLLADHPDWWNDLGNIALQARQAMIAGRGGQ